MTPEQEEIIEVMGNAIADNWQSINLDESSAIAALRAAEARGWVLARMPENRRPRLDHPVPPEDGNAGEYWTDGYESAIDDIETLKLDEGESE